ncbi:MAG: hypothetical protein COA84_13195 [Robiginitomaculum sp.]|nr:MAG: hypothetical protein COA84_13195 [Robiginitomaculum sp.]
MFKNIPKDKIGHFKMGAIVSLIVTVVSFQFLGLDISVFIGVLASAVIGTLKELYDMTGRGTPEFMDFVATVLGSLPLAAVLLVINYIY